VLRAWQEKAKLLSRYFHIITRDQKSKAFIETGKCGIFALRKLIYENNSIKNMKGKIRYSNSING